MSYAFRDNPFFKFAERTLVAGAVGHSVVMGLGSLKQFGFDKIQGGNITYLIPMLFGITILVRYHPKYYWISRYGMAALVGIGVGLGLRTVPSANIVEQLVKAITISDNVLFGIFTAVTTFTVILHFTFTIKKVHEGPQSILPQVGRYLMLIAFGAAFGNTVITRMNLLIGRLVFLVKDWLGLMA
jgi:hypothetical protein